MFVQRDADGKIKGLFRQSQTGIAEEEIDDDAPELLMYSAAQQRLEEVRGIEAQRDAALLAGVAWNGRNWHLDPTFQAQLTALLTANALGLVAGPVSIRTRDNEIVQLDIAQLKTLAATVLQRVQQIYAESWAAKDALP